MAWNALGSWDLFYLYFTSTSPKGVQGQRVHQYQGAYVFTVPTALGLCLQALFG